MQVNLRSHCFFVVAVCSHSGSNGCLVVSVLFDDIAYLSNDNSGVSPIRLNRRDTVGYFICCACRIPSQIHDFIENDCKPFTCLSSTSCFNSIVTFRAKRLVCSITPSVGISLYVRARG